jgi:hypothetical protein
MMRLLSVLAVGLATLAVPASAQTDKPNVSAPSANNSGAGIAGYPGNKNGPAANKETVGSSQSTNSVSPTAGNQDATNVKGFPGNKNGPPAKKPSEGR